MPDPEAVAMAAEQPVRQGPALSATSDAPGAQPATPAPKPEAAPEVDETAKPDNTDRTSGDKPEGEATGADKKPGEAKTAPPPKEDETPAADKAWMARERNRRQAAEKQAAEDRVRLSQALDAIDKLTGANKEKVDPRPTRDAFHDPEEYDAALIDWSARSAKEAGKAEARAEAERQQTERQVEQVLSTYQERADAFTETHPDWEDVALAEDLKISPAMSSAIMASEDGPAIAYHLGQNPEAAERISKLPAVQAVYEIGRIASKLTAPPAKPKPKPVTPLGNRNNTEQSPDDMSMADYYAKRTAEMREQRSH